MKRLYLSLIVLAMVVIGVGFYQGWFVLSSSRQAEKDGAQNRSVPGPAEGSDGPAWTGSAQGEPEGDEARA